MKRASLLPGSPEEWRKVASGGRPGDALPPEWTRELDEGVQVRPLYWADRPEEATDARAARTFPIASGPPRSMPRYEVGELGALAAAIAEDARGGVDTFWIRSGRDGPVQTVKDLERVLPSRTPAEPVLAWDAGADAAAAVAVLEAARRAGVFGPAWRWVAPPDPLAVLAADGSLPRSLAALDRETVLLARVTPAGFPTAVASTRPYHLAGARPAQEVGFALAAGLSRLRALLDGGVLPQSAASRIGFSISLGRELFPSVAKLRALRRAWRRVLAAHGIDAGAPWIHAVTSERTLTARDPWVNLLRVTGQTFAAFVGGADAVTAACFDEVVRSPSPSGRRLARNTVSILREECAAGIVRDPAGGSYLVESLTDELARSAWLFLQRIERQGSLATALQSGWVRETLDASWAQRREDLESGRAPVTGVSVFADPDEAPLEGCEEVGRGPSSIDERRDRSASAVTIPTSAGAEDAFEALVDAAGRGATLSDLAAALDRADDGEPPRLEPLPRHRDEEPFGSRARGTTREATAGESEVRA